MTRTRLLLCALLFAAIATPLTAHATMRITDIDLGVPAAPGGHRGSDPSHRVLVGDQVSVYALLWHDGNVQGWATAWSTTAPVAGMTQHPAQAGLLTANPSPFTHRLPFGGARFTAPGHYALTVSVHSQSGDATATFPIDVDELRAVVPSAQVACLAPAVQWTSPTGNGQICLNRPSTLRANPTFHGCAPNTVEFFIEAKGGATWALLGSRTAAPWSVTHTFTAAGPVRLKVVARDKNGAKAEAVITATVSQCLDASRLKH